MKTWNKFWNEIMEKQYGKTANKYCPPPFVKKIMSKYKIQEIKKPKHDSAK